MKYSFVIGLLYISSHLFAQKLYKTGDKIPNFKIQLVGQKSKVNIADLSKGKYLILDFWGIYCHPCLEGLPVLDSLQKIFSNQLLVIAINSNYSKDPQEAREFLNKNDKLKRLKLTFAVDDGTIKNYFSKGSQLPAEIWIDKTGRIQAATGGEAITYEFVKKFITDGTGPVAYTRDMIRMDPFTGPFPTHDTGFQFRTILKRASLNVAYYRVLSGFWTDPMNIENTKRVYCSGLTIKDLFYTAAFGDEIPPIQKGRYVLDVEDSLGYLTPEEAAASYKTGNYKTRTDWSLKNTFIYELILPHLMNTKVVLNEYMLKDLNRFFDVEGTIKEKETPCYLIINKTEESKKIKTAGGRPEWIKDSIESGSPADYITAIQNKSLDDIANQLNKISYTLPFVNRTSNAENIDMVMSPAIYTISTEKDISNLQKAFNQYGFDIIEGKAKIKVVVIKKKTNQATFNQSSTP